MTTGVFFKGVLIGLSIAAPVGPIGVLCIQRSLADGPAAGLAAGLGAASGDAVYGFIAGFGLTLITGFLLGQQIWIRLVGGLFLCCLGLKTLLTPVAERSAAVRRGGLTGAYFSTFGLTLSNPMTILAFVAVFAGLGAAADTQRDYLSASTLVLGVFSGSALWWLALSQGAGRLRTQFTPAGLRWVNRISGLCITGLGIAALVTFAMR